MVLTSASDIQLFWTPIFEVMFSKRVVVDVLVEVNSITQSASLVVERRMATVILSVLAKLKYHLDVPLPLDETPFNYPVHIRFLKADIIPFEECTRSLRELHPSKMTTKAGPCPVAKRKESTMLISRSFLVLPSLWLELESIFAEDVLIPVQCPGIHSKLHSRSKVVTNDLHTFPRRNPCKR